MSVPVTEREKMLAGELYHGWDPQLVRERLRAREVTRRFNGSEPADEAGRRALLAELLGSVGEGAWIEPPFHCDYGWNISLGTRAFLNFGCVVLDCAPVVIGELCQLAPSVQLSTATHPVDPAPRADGLESAHPIALGRNVWLGAGVIVGPGVTIGENAVIGAGSVVLRDIPPGVLAAGVPCRVVRDL
jgi:maltose O-acetyltransferase